MDIRPSDLALLLALDVLLTERNVTRAAERLNISQPAMSAQLARLRDLFDDPLLVSSGRRMVPSARALSLQESLHRKLLDISQLIRDSQPFDHQRTSRIFRIIATDYLHMTVTLPLVREVSRIAPYVQIVLLPFDQTTAWPYLEDLQADLLIVWRQLTPADARAVPLFRDELCFIQRRKHPRGRNNPSVDELCQLAHAVVAPDGALLRGVIDDELKKLGRARRIVASLPNFLAVPELVAQSDLVAAIPRRLANSMANRLEIFDLPIAIDPFEMLLSWHPRMHADPGHEWLRGQVSAAVAKA